MASNDAATLDPTKVPRHVAIIMDGNGRWAQQRGLPRLAGHRAGTENIRRLLENCVEFGVQYVTLYAFSTENWRRPPEEVRGLMGILENVIERELDELDSKGVQLRHLGRLGDLPPALQTKIENAIRRTAGNSRLVVCVALNYGGRAEIVDAIQRIIREGVPPERVDEALVSRHMYAPDIPDPDLIIRTAGESRLSNFLLWEAAYAEYYVTPTYWPDFDGAELRRALLAYGQRHRRFGQLK